LASLNVDFIINRFNESSFAKGANRDQIKYCQEKLGIPLEEFIQIVLTAMQQISNELGL
jgi:predicted hydrolase (HD superfamily)